MFAGTYFAEMWPAGVVVPVTTPAVLPIGIVGSGPGWKRRRIPEKKLWPEIGRPDFGNTPIADDGGQPLAQAGSHKPSIINKALVKIFTAAGDAQLSVLRRIRQEMEIAAIQQRQAAERERIHQFHLRDEEEVMLLLGILDRQR